MPPICRASSLDLFLNCSGWIGKVTKEDQKLADEEFENAETARDWGTMAHYWKETGKVLYKGKGPQELKEKEERLLANRIWNHNLSSQGLWPFKDGNHEVSVAYNWRLRFSVVHWGRVDEDWRDQWSTDWITGTTDYFRFPFKTRIAWIDDLKTGKWWYKRPNQSAQLVFYLLAFARCGLFDIPQGRLTVTHWPKYPAKSPPMRMESIVTAEQLLKFEDKLCKAAEEAGQYYNPSVDRCKFCPGRFSCIYRLTDEEKQYNDNLSQSRY